MVTIDFIMSGIVVILSFRELTLSRQKVNCFFYPAEYMQTVRRFTAYATFTRNFLLSNARIDLAIGAEYGKGGGTMIAEKQLQSGQNTPAIKLWQNLERLEQRSAIT